MLAPPSELDHLQLGLAVVPKMNCGVNGLSTPCFSHHQTLPFLADVGGVPISLIILCLTETSVLLAGPKLTQTPRPSTS